MTISEPLSSRAETDALPFSKLTLGRPDGHAYKDLEVTRFVLVLTTSEILLTFADVGA